MKIGEGMVSDSVTLKNGIVSKQYRMPFAAYTQRNIEWHWRNEIEALKKLKGKKHFPQLISVDDKEKIIYMSYCGELLTKKNLPLDWKKQCKTIEKTLQKNNIWPQDFIGNDNPVPPHQKNIHIKDGIIHIIDFGIWSKTKSNGHPTVSDIVSEIKNYRGESAKHLSNNH